MSDMTAAKAKALREKFPKSAIGQLPKPYKSESPKGKCNECGGYHGLPAVHLDYVGHAATTDRLLTVDPEWTWRPFTSEEITALPPKLRDAGLWIYLTVLGVTRPGVGDGKSAKECIGDAIRNAAMRFGVALDLWAKEDLHEIQAAQQCETSAYDEPEAQAARASEPEPQRAPEAPAEPSTDRPMTAKTRGQMFALFGQKGVPEAQQLPGINHITGADYTSRADVTEAHAKQVIAVLKKKPDAAQPDGPALLEDNFPEGGAK
jgi:hypothetical protein